MITVYKYPTQKKEENRIFVFLFFQQKKNPSFFLRMGKQVPR